MRRTLRTTLLALVVAALAAPAAHASSTMFSVMQDDDLLVYRDKDTAERTLRQMKAMGVDVVRVTVLWRVAAENARLTNREIRRLDSRSERERAKRQQRRFKGQDPRTYPRRNWNRYDDLVRLADANGIRVLFNLTGPGPSWAHRKPPKSLRRLADSWRPNATHFKRFVQAVGKRYSGEYRDEDQGRGTLPRVSIWSLWNEPNQAGWLAPQWGNDRDTGKRIPVAPKLWRDLHQKGRSGLDSTGHADDLILLAETAPTGTNKRRANEPLAPKAFMREALCVKSNGEAYTGRDARARDCSRLESRGGLRANGYAHHPYTKNVSPLVRASNPDALTMANLSEMAPFLDDLAARTGKLQPGLDIWLTEYGFETNPPDPHQGVPEAQQASWNQLGEFLAYANPRVRSQAQFLLRDVAPVEKHTTGTKAYWKTYQSGLFTLDGKPKQAFTSFITPFHAFAVGKTPEGATIVKLWGQARYRPNGQPARIMLQFRGAGQPTWGNVGEPFVTNSRFGYWEATQPMAPPGGEWRFAVLKSDFTPETFSLPISVPAG